MKGSKKTKSQGWICEIVSVSWLLKIPYMVRVRTFQHILLGGGLRLMVSILRNGIDYLSSNAGWGSLLFNLC